MASKQRRLPAPSLFGAAQHGRDLYITQACRCRDTVRDLLKLTLQNSVPCGGEE